MGSIGLLRKLGVIAVVASVYLVTAAQDAPPQTTEPGVLPPQSATGSQTAPLTSQQIDQLVAPVALYDDSLLTDILTASTYPLEVVEAHRWLSDPANAALKGNDLANALVDKDWDPSVKALTPFPSVLAMLDSHLDWTERLGEAFLAQQGDVMDAVQRLRQRAEAAGTLKSTPQQTVADDAGDVTISPPPSNMIYIPTYDPWCAYGAWPYPIYGPYYYSPWSGYCGPDAYGIFFDAGLLLPWYYWDWGYFAWHDHRIGIRRDRYGAYHPDHTPPENVWAHDPTHRVGVPYRDPRNAEQFPQTPDYRQSYRGYEGRDSVPTGFGRAPAFESFGPGRSTEMQSQRGATSRGGFGGGGMARGGFGGGMHGGGGGHGRP